MNVAELIKKAVVDLPEEVESALKKAYEREEGKIAVDLLAVKCDCVPASMIDGLDAGRQLGHGQRYNTP